MNKAIYKKYTLQAKRGIKGEAFFESLISDYALPHRIVGPKDLGIDYICEWVYGDKPAGLLFAIQIKTLSRTNIKKLELIGEEKGFNGLNKFEIHNHHLKIDNATLEYWQGLGMPIYLFVLIQDSAQDDTIGCYYKRYTPQLTGDNTQEEFHPYQQFYKVNEANRFLAFKVPGKGGFARDLFIDHVRINYFKGSLAHISPRHMGLEQFSEEGLFEDLFEIDIYKEQILAAYQKTTKFLEYLGFGNETKGIHD